MDETIRRLVDAKVAEYRAELDAMKEFKDLMHEHMKVFGRVPGDDRDNAIERLVLQRRANLEREATG